MNSMPKCATIPAGEPFSGRLARWLLDRYGREAVSLPRVLVLLPSRRACRSLRKAFLEAAGGKPLLLPRIQPLGDMDEDPGMFTGGDADIRPPMPALKRT